MMQIQYLPQTSQKYRVPYCTTVRDCLPAPTSDGQFFLSIVRLSAPRYNTRSLRAGMPLVVLLVTRKAASPRSLGY
jgi:hypothetical protein